MKKISILIITLIATIFTACTNDDETVNREDAILSSFWSNQLRGDTATQYIVDSVVVDEVYKLSYDLGNQSNKIEAGDSVFFYFVGGTLSAAGMNQLVTTNIDSIAAEYGLTGMIGRGIERGIAGKNHYIKGLDQGLTMMNDGEHSIVFFPSSKAYGDNRLGVVPTNTPLIFEIIIIGIKKN